METTMAAFFIFRMPEVKGYVYPAKSMERTQGEGVCEDEIIIRRRNNAERQDIHFRYDAS
jgi:hypothetical protein